MLCVFYYVLFSKTMHNTYYSPAKPCFLYTFLTQIIMLITLLVNFQWESLEETRHRCYSSQVWYRIYKACDESSKCVVWNTFTFLGILSHFLP